MATLPAYDDGSSTESEYYFDPLEEKQEEAAYAWAHALDAVPIKQEPIPQPSEEATEAFTANKALSESSEELALPQGSEWSHGAVVVEHSDLVERALAMASRFEQVKQKEEAMTADTVNEPSAPPVKKIKKTEIRTLKKKNKVKVMQKVVSLKAVKATPPTVRTKSVAVGLMQPRKDEGLQKELERGLSVPRTTRKMTTSQSFDSHKREGSPCRGKTANVKENGEEKEPPKRMEHKKKSPSRGKHLSRSPSSYRKAHSKSQPRRHARSPSTRRAERATRTERSKSPARSCSRKSRSRSPSRRRVERTSRTKRSKSQASHYSRRSRSTSRSPSRRRGEDRRTRSRSPYRSTSPRHRYDSQRRHYHSNERNRSPSRSSRSFNSMNERYRSKSHDRDRYDHPHDSRPDHYDDNVRKSAQSSTHSRDMNPRRPDYREVSSASRDKNEVSSRHRSNDYESSRSERFSHEKGKHISTQQGGNRSVDKRSRLVARLRGASTPRLQESEPVRLHQRLSVPVAPSTVNPIPSAGCKRSPRDPRIRPRVEASTAPNGKPRVGTTATPQPAKRFKKSTYVYHDAFEKSVFRLKLQEAHLDQMLAAAQGRLSIADQRFHGSRRRNIDADRARLQAENFERFEKLYSTTEIRPSDLQRYEDDRNFAKRVVQFKKKQASLQEQKDLFLSTETRDELWRRLDEDREQLIKENSVMFHKIMMDPHQGGPKHDRGAPFSTGQPNKRFAMGSSPANPFDATANSRVVVGASLQVEEHDLPRSFGSHRARVNNVPWFLKG